MFRFSFLLRKFPRAIGALLIVSMACGCGRHKTRVEDGNERQILHLANGAEPEDLDPQTTTGVTEDNIIRALLEGLVSEDPVDLHPVPGVAERWDISPDGKIYTFHLRGNARWSNGDPVTATDFVRSYKRALTPELANEYAYMLFYVVNAEKFYKKEITNFDEVGFKAIDDRTLRITLNHPTSYFLSLLNHHSWFPVHIPTVEKYGDPFQRGNRWTRPGHYVSNGPFILSEWKVNTVVAVKKNPYYWDAKTVRLQGIRFYPMERLDTEERAFRSGQVHKTNKLPPTKIDYYKEHFPELLKQAPYLGTYFYSFNVERPAFRDKRVRQAMAMAIDREAIVKTVTRGGETPAYSFTPPNTAGYTAEAKIPYDIERAKKLMAEAGYPNGEGFPKVELLYNTLESHKIIAEALQQMWKKNLGINVTLRNEEWKVYLDSKNRGDFDLFRYGWIADYVDPNAFLDMWLSYSGNNASRWKNPEYDALIEEAGRTIDRDARYKIFQKAEALLLDEMPVLPIYYYSTTYLLRPSVKNWNLTILDHQPYKYVYLDASAEKGKPVKIKP